MKAQLRSLFLSLALLPAALLANDKPADKSKNCGCACCHDKETCCCQKSPQAGAPAPSDDAKRYPLKGVIVDILADKSSLLVKHEAIPGYMPAMTMLFKVDATTLDHAKKGQAITGTLVHQNAEFRLEHVKPAGK